MKIKKGDKVQVKIGKDKGVKSVVEKVVTKTSKLVVKNVNIVTRHIKQNEGQGGRIKVSKPIPSSNVMLICPKCDKPTRIGYKLEGKGKKRICKKCKADI
ncbi:50S ribosomal protein L24 [bacterium]|nr:50S ribosomal protein L24 [bacterium]